MSNTRLFHEPMSEMSSARPSRRTSSIHRRKSGMASRTAMAAPFRERLFIGLAAAMQVVVLALLIAATTTDVFMVDGSRAISAGMNLTAVASALGVKVEQGSHPFCYSLWSARECGTAQFHSEEWFTERGAANSGFPSATTKNMMGGAAAFSALACGYSLVNIGGIVAIALLQDYTAVMCAWSFSTWITILISWALSVGVHARPMTTITSTIDGSNIHVKDYCSFSSSFALTMAAFALHAFQFTFTVVYTRMFETRAKALVTEQRRLADDHQDE